MAPVRRFLPVGASTTKSARRARMTQARWTRGRAKSLLRRSRQIPERAVDVRDAAETRRLSSGACGFESLSVHLTRTYRSSSVRCWKHRVRHKRICSRFAHALSTTRASFLPGGASRSRVHHPRPGRNILAALTVHPLVWKTSAPSGFCDPRGRSRTTPCSPPHSGDFLEWSRLS